MVRLIYCSKVTEKCSAEEFFNILKTAQAENAAAGVTGMLCFSSTYFLQWLEGTRQTVNSLYSRIAADARHTMPEIVSYSETHAREFAQWSMAYISVDKVHDTIVKTYCPGGEFDPYEMTGDGARQFLLAIAAARQRSDDKA